MPNQFFLEVPPNFSFKSTVYSHGWSELTPFELDEERWVLSYTFSSATGKAKPVSARIFEEDKKIVVRTDEFFQDEEKTMRDVRHILRLDDDLNDFYEITKSEKYLNWINSKNAGRLLRSPTVFEDLIKTVCTTNCSWSLTKKMVSNLVEKLGEESAAGKRSFPSAEKMAAQTSEFYREEIRAGYRSPYFVEIAEQVATRKIDPESWLTSDLPTEELKKEMKKCKGVGDYAAENLLKLVGRYDGLALDSWLRKRFYEKQNAGNACEDKDIHAFYERYGKWRGLVMWCEMTERWLNH